MVKYPWSGGEHPPRPPRRGWWGYLERHLPGVSVAVMVVLLIGFVLYPYMLITVPSGQVGVLWKRFSGPGIHCWCILPSGTVLDPSEIRNEGLTIIWPWDKLFLYDLRLQASTQKFNAISLDGVSVTAEITIRYQLIHDSVPGLARIYRSWILANRPHSRDCQRDTCCHLQIYGRRCLQHKAPANSGRDPQASGYRTQVPCR